MTVVTFYTREGCCLCDEAYAILARVRSDLPFELQIRDIAADDRLHRAYFDRIPVIALDGEELFDHFVDEHALRRRVATANGAPLSAGPAGAEVESER